MSSVLVWKGFAGAGHNNDSLVSSGCENVAHVDVGFSLSDDVDDLVSLAIVAKCIAELDLAKSLKNS